MQWLVEFLRLFYNQEDLRQQAKRHLCTVGGFASHDRLKHAEYCFCLAQAIERSPIREALETTALHSLLEDRSLRHEIASYIDLDGDDTELKSVAERMQALEEAHETVLAANVTWVDKTQDQFWRLLGSVPSLSANEKRELAHKLGTLGSEDLSALVAGLEHEIARHNQRLGSSDLTENLWEAIRCGYMANLRDVAGARTVAEIKGTPDLVAIALAACLESTPSRAALEELEKVLQETRSPYPWLIAAKHGTSLGWDTGQLNRAIERVQQLGQGDPEIWQALGGLFHDLGRYSEMLETYHQAVELDPTNGERWTLVGGALASHLKRFDEAEQAYRNAVILSPESAKVWDAFGDFLASRPGRQEEAEDAYRKSISRNPRLGQPWLDLGNLLSTQADRKAEAEEAYKKAIVLGPSPDGLEDLALFLLKETGREMEAEEICRRAISLRPKRARSWGVLGDVIRAMPGREIEAEDAYRKAIAFDPDWAAPWGCLGALFEQTDKLAEAEDAYRKATALNSEFAWAQLGCLLSEQAGRKVEAEEALRKAAAAKVDYAYPWGVLGDLLSDQSGREVEAEGAYRKAISLDPQWPNPWGRLGDLLSQQPGREADAEEAYRKTISLNPKTPNPWGAMGYLLSRQSGRENEAEEAYRNAITLGPDWFGYWISLGDLIARRPGRDAEVIGAYQRATAVNSPWMAWYSLAGYLYKVGKADTEEAEEAARKAVALSNGIGSVPTLATILVCRNKWPEAREYSRKFIIDGNGWPEIIQFFREAVKAGHAKDAVELLEEADLAGKWRPLREALAAAAEGTRAYLRRVAPEVRDPAEKILDELVPAGWGRTKPKRRKPSH